MNCLVVDDEEMSQNVLVQFIQQTAFLNIVGVCKDAIEASNIINKEKVDILFLDIEMPGMTGYQLLDTFVDNPPQVVLISAKKEHAADAFNYDVADYLLKPITYSRFLKAVSKVQGRLQNGYNNSGNREPKDMYVRSDFKIIRIAFDDIHYVEALADYIIIATGEHKHIVHSTMKGFQSRLPQSHFARVHRSYIINIDKIEYLENLQIYINKKQIPIGASYKDDFMDRLNLL